jgi:ATP-dependent HslUV protease subunit HslV
MTIIAYKDGILAADTAVWCGDLCVGHIDKVKRWNDWTYAACGSNFDIHRWELWFKNGMPEHDRPKELEKRDSAFGAIAVHKDGRIHMWMQSFMWYDISNIEPAIHVQGCNEEFIMSALLSGMSAPEAIAHGIRHLAFAGGDVTALCTTWPEGFL